MGTRIRSYTVALQAGVGHAVLPDNRSMKPSTNYKISPADFDKIGPGALASVITVVSVDTALASRQGIDLTTNTTTVPAGLKLGQVTEGFLGEAFKFVKTTDAVSVAAGDVLVWSDATNHVVTADKVGGSASSPLTFAGIACATITAGRYGWMQIDGIADAVATSADVALGDAVQLHPTVDKQLRGALLDEVQTITLTSWDAADSFKLQWPAGTGSKTVAFVSGTNGTAAAIQTALRTLTGNANLTVTGTTDAGPFTVTFVGQNADVAALAVTDGTGGTTGAVAETQKGGIQGAGTTTGMVVGEAIADRASTANDVRLSWMGSSRTSRRPRHDKGLSRSLFSSKL